MVFRPAVGILSVGSTRTAGVFDLDESEVIPSKDYRERHQRGKKGQSGKRIL